MKIFLDTANLEEIKEAASWGILDGVTTNPSLIAKEKRDFKELIQEICAIVDGDVSAEVISTDFDGMVKEARELARLADNIVVKIPLIKDGLKAVKFLKSEGIRTNVTLCFSPTQAILAAKAGAYYISPFIGRLDDISSDGMNLVKQIVQIYKNYNFETKVLVASVRHPMHVVEAGLIGADVVTMPFKVLEQMIKHPLTDIGLERFLEDWRKAQLELEKKFEKVK
ncbi:transaldolase [Candidatus Kryptonium thompsonii]|uniref:Probable transaldolase n=2 Tax=Candidatus Kryptonium thompsonii TaxID=1633631 RepID=A0A0P1P0F1_9BACT|nr:fructose-6-phosphate aldolase [Candidatus Kryptonium thompsoni]CUS77812.1 transaldolase [Candidatus Kryptonium thompsoni]CUS79309.1 transaldolase [Candidatus Kryptonium thompsoni]CUS81500.1 transaldolase [Candidatus Kryptonium thompsoni]CUS86659.1 transaldolase [Candidatus Kryptonium thompsoni]CUS90223.1 transaldolase [Candidatus Kryptonium thompsoni]